MFMFPGDTTAMGKGVAAGIGGKGAGLALAATNPILLGMATLGAALLAIAILGRGLNRDTSGRP